MSVTAPFLPAAKYWYDWKNQEGALRFVLRDKVSSCDVLLEKAGYESFRIHVVKLLFIEMFKIFTGLSPKYLSDIFEKSDDLHCMRNKNKLIQPVKGTMTYGLRSFEYYGSHVWNMLCISKVENPFEKQKIV